MMFFNITVKWCLWVLLTWFSNIIFWNNSTYLRKCSSMLKQKVRFKTKILKVYIADMVLSKLILQIVFLLKLHKILLKTVYKWRSRKGESGSTARNATARISTARHFFWKSHLLDSKMSTARQKKVCRTCSTCQFRAVDKKSETARNFEQWQNNWDSKI